MKQTEKKMTPIRKEDGFTLLELLVALAILALLTTLVAPRVIGYLGSSKSKAAGIQLANIEGSLDLYLLDNSTYPKSLQGLLENTENSTNWAGPYLKSKQGIIDPWGRSYRYTIPGENRDYDLISLGADNKEGGDGEDLDIKAQ